MDVEYSEWRALIECIDTLSHVVRQFALETHTSEMDMHWKPNKPCTWSTKQSLSVGSNL